MLNLAALPTLTLTAIINPPNWASRNLLQLFFANIIIWDYSTLSVPNGRPLLLPFEDTGAIMFTGHVTPRIVALYSSASNPASIE